MTGHIPIPQGGHKGDEYYDGTCAYNVHML